MGVALTAAVSGLRAHDQLINTVGNNLANLSTHGFKTKRVLFRDLVSSQFVSTAKSATESTGGTNPGQFGSGVQPAIVDAIQSQGALEATGAQFDFAIEGEGYFMVDDGSTTLYTRVGSFSLDDTGTLVDPATGFRVQRFGVEGEPIDGLPGFQIPGDRNIRVPFGATIPGNATTRISIGGNLPSTASAPVAQSLASVNPFTVLGSPADSSTLLSSLDTNTASYVSGDTLEISGVDVDGTPVSASMPVDATTTMGNLTTFIDGLFAGADASFDANGRLVLDAQTPGLTNLSLTISDGPGNAGSTIWTTNAPVVQVAGQDGAIVENSVEVFDPQGGAHTLAVTFQKTDVNEWDMTIALDQSEGTVIDSRVEGIIFNDDGTIRELRGTGVGDANIEVQFKNFSTSQEIALDFGVSGLRDGLSHLAVAGTIDVDQDGFGSGTLTEISVSRTGLLQADSSNGRKFPLAQLAVARFRNPKGLQQVSGSYLVESPSSGEVQVGPGQNGGRGVIRGGHLEGSNVDMALQFTSLIVAQRGFSANARTITVADQLLQELTQLIR